MSQTALYAAVAFAGAEATGVTNFTGLGQSDSGDESKPSNPGIPGLAGRFDLLNSRLVDVQATAQEARTAAQAARSAGEVVRDVQRTSDTATRVVETVKTVEVPTVEPVTGGGGGGPVADATEWWQSRGGGRNDTSGNDGPAFDFTPDESPVRVGIEGDTPLIDFTSDPTGLVATGENAFDSVTGWGDSMTGDATRTIGRIAGGDNPVNVVAEEGDGPLGGFTRGVKRWYDGGENSKDSKKSSDTSDTSDANGGDRTKKVDTGGAPTKAELGTKRNPIKVPGVGGMIR